MSDGCQKEEMSGRCCCNCRYHIQDNMHCTTVVAPRCCVCGIQKGWICMPPEFQGEQQLAFSGWTEHGMCEMHAFKPNKEN
jgi:hypothetical protein